MMLRILRKLNLLLIAIVGWQVVGTVYSQSAIGQAAPFLYRPYYGNFPGNWFVGASFDHRYPTYATNYENGFRYFVKWNGGTITEPPYDISVIDGNNCSVDGWSCYDGHSGYDFGLNYQPVVASAAGVVSYAGWADTNHEIDLGLKIEMDHANFYRTIYGHLSMVRYQTNNTVGRWQIGTSGTSGNSTGPHLHFEVQRDYNGAYRRTDPYGWKDINNNYDNADDPWAQHDDGSPSTYLWVSNPFQGDPTYNNSITLDDGDSGFATHCASGNYWWPANGLPAVDAGAYGDDLWFTYPNGYTTNCYATWQIDFPHSGTYEVKVSVPNWGDRTHAARYTIYYTNANNPTVTWTRTVVLDQHHLSNAQRWISLGRYYFRQGTHSNGLVKLEDAAYIGLYNEDTNAKQILVDAVKWEY